MTILSCAIDSYPFDNQVKLRSPRLILGWVYVFLKLPYNGILVMIDNSKMFYRISLSN